MADQPEERAPGRGARSRLATGSAAALVVAALVAPAEPAGAWLRLPVEAIVLGGVLLALTWASPRARRGVAAVLGALLGLVTIVKILNIGFLVVFSRAFDPVIDWTFLRPAAEFVLASMGRPKGIAVLVVAALVALALPVGLGWAVRRLADVTAAMVTSGVRALRRASLARTAGVLAAVWVLLAAVGSPLAGASVVRLVVQQSRQVAADLNDRDAFTRVLAADPWRGVPNGRLLTALRGKDVLLVFVESYGRVALADPGVRAVLDEGGHRLRAAGFEARTALLTSSTLGGASWLAHATLQSGLWVDGPLRYDALLRSDRLTLSRAFARAGWRTVCVAPANTRDWPEGRAFYGFDEILDSRTLGYRGPLFAMHSIPDQFTLAVVERLLAAPGPPVMAEIDLLSGHAPWRPVPPTLPWDQVGDGGGYPSAAGSDDLAEVIFDEDPARVRADYAAAMRYTLGTLLSFVERLDDETVVVLLGDHQPFSIVAGTDASRDVPISVLARDPTVLARLGDWSFSPGLLPSGDAPVWPMDAFRDRFLAAFG
jgi:hypothetical protein